MDIASVKIISGYSQNIKLNRFHSLLHKLWDLFIWPFFLTEKATIETVRGV